MLNDLLLPHKGFEQNFFIIIKFFKYVIFILLCFLYNIYYAVYIFSVVTIQHVQSQLYIAMNSDGRLITTVSFLFNVMK